ncbi:MAG: hydroxymethylbilane synthase, partial [Candidatus Methanospirareceae archaeon]
MAQAECVKKLLEERGVETELKVIKTRGDRFSESFLAGKRPKERGLEFGLFVKELDDALLRDEIDIAVHSMKDIPTRRPEGLEIAAVMERETPYEAFVTVDGTRLAEMKEKAVIGTSSMRRRAQLLRFRKDFIVKDLRGNVTTRLRKIKEGMYDGMVIAEVGLHRLKLVEGEGRIKGGLFFERLPMEHFLPPANQGIIAVVAREESEEAALMREFDHEKTRIEAYV